MKNKKDDVKEPPKNDIMLVIRETDLKYTYAMRDDVREKLSETQKTRVAHHVTELLKIFNGDKGLIY